MGSLGNPNLPGQKGRGWDTRTPKLPEGFTKTSPEGRLLLYFQQHPRQVHPEAELMAETKIQAVSTLRKTISELRAVITGKIIRTHIGYIYEE